MGQSGKKVRGEKYWPSDTEQRVPGRGVRWYVKDIDLERFLGRPLGRTHEDVQRQSSRSWSVHLSVPLPMPNLTVGCCRRRRRHACLHEPDLVRNREMQREYGLLALADGGEQVSAHGFRSYTTQSDDIPPIGGAKLRVSHEAVGPAGYGKSCSSEEVNVGRMGIRGTTRGGVAAWLGEDDRIVAVAR